MQNDTCVILRKMSTCMECCLLYLYVLLFRVNWSHGPDCASRVDKLTVYVLCDGQFIKLSNDLVLEVC